MRVNPFRAFGLEIDAHINTYPTPPLLNYYWGLGSLSGICLGIQIITGFFLVCYYNPDISEAFNSVEHIMRDVNYGWVVRYFHANGASMFFIVVYLHMARGLYYSSHMIPRAEVWVVGVVTLIAIMATAFLGYVLPWGQMSFWGATVITNLFSAIPFVGEHIVYWLWGGFSVGESTLTRFFALHYLLPMIIAVLAIIHLIILHSEGSNNPLGVQTSYSISFMPYFLWKDLMAFWIFAGVFCFLVFFAPNYLGHPDNYIPANPMVTPTHIVPEWYFLPFYAILRSIPDKLLGVIAMFGALIALMVIPLAYYVSSYIYTTSFKIRSFRPLHKFFTFLFFLDFLILLYIGGCPVEYPYVLVGQIATFFYFFYLLIIYPFLYVYDSEVDPLSIAVLESKGLKGITPTKYFVRVIQDYGLLVFGLWVIIRYL